LLAILFFRHKDFANQPNRNVQQLQLHCLNEQIKCVATNRAENTGRYITEHFIELSKLTYFTLPDAHCWRCNARVLTHAAVTFLTELCWAPAH